MIKYTILIYHNQLGQPLPLMSHKMTIFTIVNESQLYDHLSKLI